jgi:hypothetical protein
MTAKGRTAEYLVRYIRKPGDLNRFASMPAYPLGTQELQDLAGFVRALDFSDYPMRIVQLRTMTQEKE